MTRLEWLQTFGDDTLVSQSKDGLSPLEFCVKHALAWDDAGIHAGILLEDGRVVFYDNDDNGIAWTFVP